jgi:hypothetical protein
VFLGGGVARFGRATNREWAFALPHRSSLITDVPD